MLKCHWKRLSRELAHPSSQGFIDSVTQCPASRVYSNYFGAEKLHSEYIECLSPHVFSAHIYGAFEVEFGTHCSCCNTVLPSACLGDDLCRPKAFSKENLADGIVDLMRSLYKHQLLSLFV